MRTRLWTSILTLSLAALSGGCKKSKPEHTEQAGSAQAGSAQAAAEQAAAAQPAGWQPNSLCKDGEQVFFSCTLKDAGTLVSLCGSQEATQTTGYVKYRSGTADKIELEFPATEQKTQSQFTYELDTLHDGSEVVTVAFAHADKIHGVFNQAGPDTDISGTVVPEGTTTPLCATVHAERLPLLEKIVQRKGDPTPVDPSELCCCKSPRPEPTFRPAGECAKTKGAKCVDANLCNEPPEGEDGEE